MNFYGQQRIVQELLGFASQIRGGANFSLAVTAPSGYGKTTLVFLIVKRAADDEDIEYLLPDVNEVGLNLRKRVHIVDEIHLLQKPEVLYPIMDSGKHTFFFLTNEKGTLKEPLRNRCITFNLEPYTSGEIACMVRDRLEEHGITLKEELIDIVVRESNLIPRVALVDITTRLINLFKVHGVPTRKSKMRKYIREYLGIKDGLNRECQRYVNFLKGKERASLDLISTSIRLERNYIKSELEPVLVDKGLIEITARGRRLL